MRNNLAIVAVAALLILPASLAAQQNSPAQNSATQTSSASAQNASAPYVYPPPVSPKVPRTKDGHPD